MSSPKNQKVQSNVSFSESGNKNKSLNYNEYNNKYNFEQPDRIKNIYQTNVNKDNSKSPPIVMSQQHE